MSKRGQLKEVIVRLTEHEAEALEKILYGQPQPAATLFHRVSRARARVTAKYQAYRQSITEMRAKPGPVEQMTNSGEIGTGPYFKSGS